MKNRKLSPKKQDEQKSQHAKTLSKEMPGASLIIWNRHKRVFEYIPNWATNHVGFEFVGPENLDDLTLEYVMNLVAKHLEELR